MRGQLNASSTAGPGATPAAAAISSPTGALNLQTRVLKRQRQRHRPDLLVNRAPVEQALSGTRPQQAGQHPGQGQLARAVSAYYEQSFTLVDGAPQSAQGGLPHGVPCA